MHFPTMAHHANKRNRSFQFERGIRSLDSADGSLTRMGPTSQPAPNSGTSSLSPEMKENSTGIRHYKSMLDVEPAPKLPIAQPLSYEELYPRPMDGNQQRVSHARQPLASQTSSVLGTSPLLLFYCIPVSCASC